MADSILVNYSKNDFKKVIDSKTVKEYVKKILKMINVSNIEMSISFVTEEEIHSYNKQYRNIDSSTDIISFALCDNDDEFNFNINSKRKNIGDILICFDVAKRNADEFNVSFNEELHRLIIHGVLHLNGYNHETNDFKTEKMLILQEQIISCLGL